MSKFKECCVVLFKVKRLGLNKRQHVVVTAMNAMHENNEVIGTICHSQAQNLREKINRVCHLVGKQQGM